MKRFKLKLPCGWKNRYNKIRTALPCIIGLHDIGKISNIMT